MNLESAFLLSQFTHSASPSPSVELDSEALMAARMQLERLFASPESNMIKMADMLDSINPAAMEREAQYQAAMAPSHLGQTLAARALIDSKLPTTDLERLGIDRVSPVPLEEFLSDGDAGSIMRLPLDAEGIGLRTGEILPMSGLEDAQQFEMTKDIRLAASNSEIVMGVRSDGSYFGGVLLEDGEVLPFSETANTILSDTLEDFATEVGSVDLAGQLMFDEKLSNAHFWEKTASPTDAPAMNTPQTVQDLSR